MVMIPGDGDGDTLTHLVQEPPGHHYQHPELTTHRDMAELSLQSVWEEAELGKMFLS